MELSIKNEKYTNIEKVDISIIIPLYKGFKYCNRLLDLIKKNCLYKNLYKQCLIEVIFVNDYPQERMVLQDEKRVFDVQLCIHERNQGIHAARITGIRNSRGQYIIMLDQDDLARENWIYSQWHKIREENAGVCFCNGWKERFRVLEKMDIFEQEVMDKRSFFTKGNPIVSPGQAIINRDHIPEEWLDNIQRINGADDFLLWIMMEKKGCRFALNREYLYYHSPERTKDSIDFMHMIESEKETLQILSDINLLDEKEIFDFRKYIRSLEIDLKKEEQEKSIPKDTKLFHLMRRWLNLKNKGIGLTVFFTQCQYYHIAVYGFGCVGESLYYELCNGNIVIEYAIDMNPSLVDFKNQVNILKWEDKFYDVDAVVVTLVEDYKDVISKLKDKLNCPIITIDQVVSALETTAALQV